jgi:hypothetical protein
VGFVLVDTRTKKLHKQGGATEYAAQVLLGKSSGKDMSFFAHSV